MLVVCPKKESTRATWPGAERVITRNTKNAPPFRHDIKSYYIQIICYVRWKGGRTVETQALLLGRNAIDTGVIPRRRRHHHI